MQQNYIETEKDASCYTVAPFSRYVYKKGITQEQLFKGIEEYRETLLNPLEWIQCSIYQQYLLNAENALAMRSETLYNVVMDWVICEKNAFQLFFFRLVPISLISEKISKHVYKTIHKKINVTLEYTKDGESDVYFTPLPGIVYSTQYCDLNRASTFALFSLRGYKNVTLTEVSCCVRDPGEKACHYKVTWSPRPSWFRLIRDLFFLRYRNYQSIIHNMQQSQEKLQSQYDETKRLYDRVVESESRFRSVFENIQDIYFEIAGDGTVLEISPSITAFTSYSRADLLNTKFQDLCVEKKSLSDIVHILQTRERISDYDLLIKDKNGHIIPCTIAARLIEDNGQVKLTGVLRDSTERKKVEQEKQQLQEQLRQSEKLQALGRMAGGVAHDFKNQLFGIAANARLIKSKRGQDTHLATCADNILKSAYRSSELTKQLLAFARRGKFQTVAIDLHETVKDLVLLLERTLNKTIKIDTRLDAHNSVISGDPSQIENALLNLAFNSRDAMPGGGTLTIITEEIALDETYCTKSEFGISAGRYIKISVKDTGKGIEKEHLHSLFEPFFTTKEFGNGLGLSAVYGTVKEHCGAIEIETMPGIGTTVSLLLPEASSKAITREKQGEIVRAESQINLLLTEDEEIVRNGAKEVLGLAGFNVHAFGDANSTLQYYTVNYHAIHLVLLDMVLPDMGIQELFSRIQRINPQAQIVLWSAYTVPEIVLSLREKGALDFIDKGCDINEFLRKMSVIAEKMGQMGASRN